MAGYDSDIKLSVKLKPEDVRKSSQTLQGELEKVFNQREGTTDKNIMRLEAQMDKAILKAQSLTDKMTTLENTKIPTQEYTEISKQIENASKTFDRLLVKQDEMLASGNNYGKAWDTLQSKMEEASNTIIYAKGELKDLVDKGQAFTLGSDTQQYQDTANQLSQVNNQMRILIEANNEYIRKEAEAAAKARETAEAKAAADAEKARAKEEAAQAANLKAGRQILVSALGKEAKKAAAHISNLTKKLMQLASSGIKRGIDKLTNGIFKIGKNASGTDISVKKLTKTFLKYALGIRSFYILFRKLRSAIAEGFSNLKQFQDGSTDTARALTGMQNNLTYLKNAWATAFAPLVTFVVPAINKVISALATLATYIGSVFSLLTGKSTMLKAKQNMEGYGDAAGGAAEKQKEFNAEMYGFDELNKQNKKNDGSGGGAADMFEEVPVEGVLPKWLEDWTKQLKKLWDNEEFFNVGSHIAELLNKGMKKLNDFINNEFRPAGVKWAKNIAEVLNGLVDKTAWKLAGETLASGTNAIFDILNTFLTKFNFLKLGQGVGIAIKSWFDNVEWNLIGATFANKWNALLHFIEGVVTTPGIWESIGKSIGQFVKSWFTTLDLNSLATIVISLFNGVTAAINAFLDEKPFEGMGSKIASAINRILYEVDWKELGAAFNRLIKDFLGEMKIAAEETDWEKFGEDIGNFLGEIEWWGILSDVADILLDAFTGTIAGLFKTDGGRAFLALVAALGGLSLAFSITQGVLNIAVQRWILTGVSPLETIPAIVKGVTTATSGALSGLAGAFQAAAPIIGTAALGVADALLIAYDVKSYYEASKTYNDAQKTHNQETEQALNAFKKLYAEKGPEVAAEWAKMAYEIDVTGMSMDQAQQAIVDKVDSYWDGVPQNMWEGFQAGWDSYFGADGKGFLAYISDAFNGMLTGIGDLLGIHSPSTVFRDMSINMVLGLIEGLKSKWSSFISDFTGKWSSMKSDFDRKVENWKDIGSNIVNGIKNGIANGWSNLTSWVSQKAQSLLSAAKSALGIKSPSKEFAKIGRFVDLGFIEGLESEGSAVESAVTDLMESTLNEAPTPELAPDLNTSELVTGLDSVLARLAAIADKFSFITDRIHQLSDIPIPAVASGGVIPYQSARSSNEQSQDERMQGFAETLAETIRTAFENITTSGNNSPNVIKIDVNGREIFNVVVDENNKEIRRKGSSSLVK